MKKILFLVKKHQYQHEPLFIEAAKSLDIELVVQTYDEMVIQFQKDQHTIWLGEHNLLDFDLVFFRTVGEYIEQETLISEYCLQHQIPVVDSVFQHNKPWIDKKSFEYQRLMSQNIPVIDSFFVSKQSFSKIQNQIEYPLIAKITGGSKGDGVYKCNSEAELLATFDSEKQPLLIQKYIPNTGDLRVFIVGNSVLGAIKRTSSNTTEFRNNVSLGGSAQAHTLTDAETQLALRAARALQYEIAGVDIITDTNGNLFIMEVNRAPQFTGFMETTKIDVPYKIVEFLASKI